MMMSRRVALLPPSEQSSSGIQRPCRLRRTSPTVLTVILQVAVGRIVRSGRVACADLDCDRVVSQLRDAWHNALRHALDAQHA